MPRLAWSVAIPLSLLASSVLADGAPVAAPMSLNLATGPTSRLDQHEMWAGVLAPLLAARYLAGTLRLLGLGVPTQTQLRFTHVGWRPRWPFC